MIREHQEYGDGPQAFDIGTERGASVSRGGRCHVRHGTRSCAPLPARSDGHTKTPEGTWSAVLSPDVNTVTATCDPSPFGQRLRYRDAVLLGTELSTSFVFRRPIPRYLSTTNPRSGRRRGGWIRRRWSDQAADKQMPEGTRSLDAPTEVNPSQITRCSCPFGQEERYETGGIGDKALIHDFHRRCVVLEVVVHTVPTAGGRRPDRGCVRPPLTAPRAAVLIGTTTRARSTRWGRARLRWRRTGTFRGLRFPD